MAWSTKAFGRVDTAFFSRFVYSSRVSRSLSVKDCSRHNGNGGTHTAGVDALRIAVKAERFAGEEDDTDVDYYGIGARYGYGMGDVYGGYQYVDAEDASTVATENGGDDSFNEFNLGVTYNISSAMYTYIEYAQYDRSGDASDGAAVGIYYGF